MRKTTSSVLPLVAILISLLLMLTLLISYYPLPSFDVRLMQSVQSLGSTKTLAIMNAISVPGNLFPAVSLFIIVAISLSLSPLRIALLPLSLVIPADLISTGLKELVDRPRPDSSLVAVHQMMFDPAFPSSHVVHYTVFFGFLAYLLLNTQVVKKQLQIPLASLAIALVCLIPFSRMYLGAHWPTDVLGGLLLGGSILVLQVRMWHKLYSRA